MEYGVMRITRAPLNQSLARRHNPGHDGYYATSQATRYESSPRQNASVRITPLQINN